MAAAHESPYLALKDRAVREVTNFLDSPFGTNKKPAPVPEPVHFKYDSGKVRPFDPVQPVLPPEARLALSRGNRTHS
jgi:hypothetical protein